VYLDARDRIDRLHPRREEERLDTLLSPEDLPNWVPGRIIGKSDDLGWKGVALRSYAYRGQDVEVPALRDFMLVSYRQGVTPMQRRFDGRWSQATCGPGAVSLLTRCQRSHWHWVEDIDVTHVYLRAEFVCSVANEFSGGPVSNVELADLLRTDDPILSAGVDAITSEAMEGGEGGALYVDAVARQVVIHLLRKYASVSLRPLPSAGCLSIEEKRKVVEYIDATLDGSVSLEDLAQQLNMGACAFARSFRNSMGVAPYEYVVRRRIDRARRLLKETGDPVKMIALGCGFSDQAHLTRMFTRHVGMPPASFRRQFRSLRE
jgi:AraC family transcriptional regulator